MYVLIVVGWMSGQTGEPSVARHEFERRETCEAIKRTLENDGVYTIKAICIPK
jgi:hypothetical protein